MPAAAAAAAGLGVPMRAGETCVVVLGEAAAVDGGCADADGGGWGRAA